MKNVGKTALIGLSAGLGLASTGLSQVSNVCSNLGNGAQGVIDGNYTTCGDSSCPSSYMTSGNMMEYYFQHGTLPDAYLTYSGGSPMGYGGHTYQCYFYAVNLNDGDAYCGTVGYCEFIS